MPATPTTPGQADSARKIANYTQSISSGVTNLLTELGRVSTATSPPSSDLNNAILLQLQTITTQIAAVNTRLDRIESTVHGPDKRPSYTPNSTGSELIELPVGYHHLEPPTAEEHNILARLHNQSLRLGNQALLPLHNSNNNRILGFPATLGHLVFLKPIAVTHLCKAFGLSDDGKELYKFCGVSYDVVSTVSENFVTAESIALGRAVRRQKRNAEMEAAGPPTAQSRRAAENHNRIARAKNSKVKTVDEEILPIHDERNITVTGFPKYARGLFNARYEADVLFFLGEYGQGAYATECEKRWAEFVGVSMDVAYSEDVDVYTGSRPYWRM